MKMNRKGFTIVELVIVIAVIAILAAVLIPTFSSVVANAHSVAALQQASSGRDALMTLTGGTLPDGTMFVIDRDGDNLNDYFYLFTRQTMEADEIDKNTKRAATPVEYYSRTTVEEVTTTTYAVYVSADAVKDNTDTKKKDVLESTLVMINDAFEKSNISARLTVSDNVTKTSVQPGTVDGQAIVFTATDNTVVNIYYSGDLKTTMVVFVGHD